MRAACRAACSSCAISARCCAVAGQTAAFAVLRPTTSRLPARLKRSLQLSGWARPGSRRCLSKLRRGCSLGLLALLPLADLSCLLGRREPGELPAFAFLSQASCSQVLKRDLARVQLWTAARMCCSPSPWKAAEGEPGACQSLLNLALNITSFPTRSHHSLSQQLSVVVLFFNSSHPG